MTSYAASPHVDAHLDLRRRTRLAEQDASGYLAGVRELRRREAAELLRGKLLERLDADRGSAAELWLRASIGVALLGCAVAGLGVVVGLLG